MTNELLHFKNNRLIIKTDIIEYNPYPHQLSTKYINPFINLTDDLLIIENEYIFNTKLSAYWLQINKINNILYDKNNKNKKIDLYDLTKTYYEIEYFNNEKYFVVHLCDKCLRYAFGHYIWNLFPILYYYKQYHYDMILCYSERINNSIMKNLINILQIDNNKIKLLKDNICYFINDIYTYQITNSDWIMSPVKWLVKYVRFNTNIASENKTLYIKYNSNNKSTLRKIINNDEIEQYCINHNIDLLDMSKYTIEEKAQIMPKYKSIIVLYGSGIHNCIFNYNLENLITFNSRALHETHNNVCIDWIKNISNKFINSYYYIYENASLNPNCDIYLDINWLNNIIQMIKT